MINELLDRHFSLFDDAPVFVTANDSHDVEITPISEKPDFMDASVWEMFYVKSEYPIRFRHISFIKISDIFVGMGRNNRGKFFICFKEDNFSYKPLDATNYFSKEAQILIMHNTEQIDVMYSSLCEYYGEDYVAVFPNTFHTLPAVSNMDSNYYKIVVYHGERTVQFKYGAEYDIFGTISVFNFGVSNGSMSNPCFGSIQRDGYSHITGILHPHCPNMSSNSISTVCLGSGSPINSAKSVFVENPNEETAYSFILTYDNLISKEAEKGVPYYRLKDFFFQRNNDNVSLATNDIIQGIKNKKISLNINVSSDIKVNINRTSLSEFLSEQGGDTFFYYGPEGTLLRYMYHEFDDEFYWSDSNEFITIKNNVYKYEIIPTDPKYVRLDPIKKSKDWRMSGAGMPPERIIIQAENTINQHLLEYSIQNFTDVNHESNKQYSRELFGIKEISRNTSIEDIPEFATAN